MTSREIVSVGDDHLRWWVYVEKPYQGSVFMFARGGIVEDRREIPLLIHEAQAAAAQEFLIWRGFTHLLSRDGALVALFGETCQKALTR